MPSQNVKTDPLEQASVADNNVEIAPPLTSYRFPEEEINLLDLFLIAAKRKEQVAVIIAACTALGALISFLLPPVYKANVKILAPQPSPSISFLQGQLGVLAGIAPKDLGIKNPNEVYVAMLSSRTIADHLVEQFDLRHVYREKWLADARAELADRTDISMEKESVISISVEDRDPRRAADLANRYIEELRQLNQALSVTEASRRRLFFEEQLFKAKEDLSKAESELERVQETTGLLQPESQARAIIQAVATVEAQIAAREVQLHTMRSFASEQNPDVVRIQQELAGLRAQLARMKKNPALGGGEVQIGTGKMPEATLAYLRKLRDVKYNETVFELLAKQYETARIDEAKDAAVIQVMDAAVRPEKRYRPKRLLLTVLALLAGCILAGLWLFLREVWERLQRDPRQRAKFHLARTYLRLH